MMPPDPWQPTLRLRWLYLRKEGTKTLQMLWRNVNSGEAEWRDIPEEVE